jgi:DNA-binding NarL/FixJ family response regulator
MTVKVCGISSNDFSHNRSDLKISGVAYRGLEAIQKTADLQLDLVLLDIGFPDRNGIQAADRLRQLVRKGKIIFVNVEAEL